MSVLRDRSWVNLLILLLASVLLAGCLQTEEEFQNYLRGMARDFVTALEVDVLEEEHSFLSAIRQDMPSSWITSKYVISDAPEDVRVKLKAFHNAQEFWLAPSKDGWSRDVKLQILNDSGGTMSPAKMEDSLETFHSLKDDSEIDFFVICPWYVVGAETYATLYSDTVILTEKGTLVIQLHSAAQDRCHDENREQ